MLLSSVIILGGVFFLSGCKAKPEDGNMAPEAKTEKSQEKEQEKLAKMLESGDAVKCQIKDEMGEYILWAKGGKMKIEGINYAGMKEGEENKKGSMISDGKFIYTWSDKEGMKMSIEAEEAELDKEESGEDTGEANVQDWSDWAKEKDKVGAQYDCQATDLSDSDFTPPGDVVFQDFSQFMKNLQSGMDLESLKNLPAQE